MEVRSILGVIAGIIAFAAYAMYIFSILKGTCKPNRATWWIWAIMGFIIALSYFFTGARNTLWVAVAEFLGPLSIALLSLKYGEGGLNSKLDTICLIGAFISILLWIIFDNPVIALVSSLTVDIFAIIPTIIKSYLRSEDEDFTAWFGTWISDTINLFAIEKYTFGILVYPIYCFLLTSIIVVILLNKKMIQKFKK